MRGLLIDLQPGPQVLQGEDLEGFLRWRHDEEGDLGRLARQQLVLRSLFGSMTRPKTSCACAVEPRSEPRHDLGAMELGGLITAMGITELETERLPARPAARTASVISIRNGRCTRAVSDASDSSSQRQRFLY